MTKGPRLSQADAQSSVTKVTQREKKPAHRPLVERINDEDTVVRHLCTETQQLNLLERIALLEREEWTPEVCHICGKVNPKHSNLECPLYEQCDHCNGTRAYGYCNSHTCYGRETTHKADNTEHNECDYNLYWNHKD